MSTQVAKLIARIAENLPEIPADLTQWWIENPLELQGILVGLSKKPSPKCDVWKTIKLGTGLKTADDFRASLKGNGFSIGDWANDILGKPEFVVATEEKEVDLVKVTVAELGFNKGARRDQIYERARELGLEPCPSEVGPQLRLQYKDQPNNEWILIGMDPICHSDGGLRVFSVERDDSVRWLYGHYDGPGSVWGPGFRWAFVRPRK
ncbi:MAG: hypothetical protein NTW46_03450 [Candidatus Nealsonbacteria bacterium]|nr:hypothetical protein [Candidatus Nealsonbacteria bacterium]